MNQVSNIMFARTSNTKQKKVLLARLQRCGEIRAKNIESIIVEGLKFFQKKLTYSFLSQSDDCVTIVVKVSFSNTCHFFYEPI